MRRTAISLLLLMAAGFGIGQSPTSPAAPNDLIPPSAADASVGSADPLSRAIEAVGGEPALEPAQSLSMVMVGTQDLKAIDQGYFAARPSPQRHQETLIIDVPSRRAVIRTAGGNSDGSPTTWRNTVLGDSGFRLKVKSGSVIRMGKDQTASLYENLRWMVPQLALSDMRARRDKLRCGETRTLGKQVYDVCQFESEESARFSVVFSRLTGLLSGYEYSSLIMRGRKAMRYAYKPYVASGIGLIPSGYRFMVGNEVFRDLDLIDAQPAVLQDHPWFKAPPADGRPVSTVPQQPPVATEEVADGVWFIRNVAGYNVMVARVGDCAAVLDAPASFGHFGGPIPGTGSTPNRSAMIIERVRETTGMRVCYVIPTNHHSDHFGGIEGFVRAGATIITTPGNAALVRETIRAAGISARPKLRLVQGKLTLGAGAGRLDIWAIRDDPDAEAMVFIHFPGHNLAFEGDLSDYIPSAWNFLRFIGDKKLKVDRLFSSHGSRPHTLEDLQWEEPDN